MFFKMLQVNFKDAMQSPEVNSTSPNDLGETCTLKLFWEDLSFVNPFTFSDITETDFKRKILKLNPKESWYVWIYPNKSPKRILKMSIFIT